MAEVLQEPISLEAHSLHSGSISFGRFETEPLSWERRSAFSRNNYIEDVKRYSTPGSVNQRKAYFEVFFKKKGLLQPPDSLFQNWTESQGKHVDDSNYMDLYRESLPERDEEISNNHNKHTGKEMDKLYQSQDDHMILQREDNQQANVNPKSHAISKLPQNHQMFGKSSSGLRKSHKVTLETKAGLKTASTKLQTTSSSNTVIKGLAHLQKEDLSRSRTIKKAELNISTAKTSLSKTPKSTKLGGVDKQKKVASAKVKEAGKAVSVIQTSNKRKDGSITDQSTSRPHKVARSSITKTLKPSASTINGNQNGQKSSNKNERKQGRINNLTESSNSKATRTPAIHSMIAPQGGKSKAMQSGRKSSDPASKATIVESTTSTLLSIRQLGPQLSKTIGTPSKGRENMLPLRNSPGVKQVESKKHDLSPSQTVSKSSKLSKLQSQSSTPSPVRRDLRESSAASSIKLLNPQSNNRTASPTKVHLPSKHLPGGKEVETRKRDLSPQNVCTPSKLAILQRQSSSLSPICLARTESSTSSSIKQLSSQCINRTESPQKSNLSTNCSMGGNEVSANKRDLHTSQTLTKSGKVEMTQSKSSNLSPVRKSPSESSISSSINKLSSQISNITESPLKNDFPMKCLSGGKEVAEKEYYSNSSQTISKQSKLEKLQPKTSFPSPVRRAPAASSKSSSTGDLSSQTKRNESPLKKSETLKNRNDTKKVAAEKEYDLNSSQTISKQPKVEKLQPKTSFPSPVRRAPAASSKSLSTGNLSSQTKRNESPLKKSETPKNRNDTKQVAEKEYDSNSFQTISKQSKLEKLQLKTSFPSPVRRARAASSESSSTEDLCSQTKRNESPLKRSETPKNRNHTKQVGTKRHLDNPLKCESILDKSAKLQVKPSSLASKPVVSTVRTNNIESLGGLENVKAVKRSKSPSMETGMVKKRNVFITDQMDKIGKRSRKVVALRC